MSYKNIIIWSNCQGEGLRVFMTKTNAFKNSNIKVLKNYMYINEKRDVPVNELSGADVFIYQPLSEKNGIYSDEHILPLLSSSCVKLSFPYIYNDALWPFYSNYMDPINKLKEQGYSCEEVITMYKNGTIDYNFDQRMENTLKILDDNEKNTDIKVLDYIRQNIKEKKLFITQNHPTSTIFIHCVNQILSLLNIDEKLFDKDYGDNILDIFGKYMPFILPISDNEIRHYGFKYIDKGYKDADRYYIDCIKHYYDKSYTSSIFW